MPYMLLFYHKVHPPVFLRPADLPGQNYTPLKKGLIQRIKDPEDSRVHLLSLTPQGQKKMNEINEFLDEVYGEVLSRMATDQRRAMLTNLDILKASMEAVKEMMV